MEMEKAGTGVGVAANRMGFARTLTLPHWGIAQLRALSAATAEYGMRIGEHGTPKIGLKKPKRECEEPKANQNERDVQPEATEATEANMVDQGESRPNKARTFEYQVPSEADPTR